jgi:transcriptional regulator with GAF, ATPase, and Fis domain
MNQSPPRLIAIGGKLKSSSFELNGEEIYVGRDASNQICLHDPSVSRKHCLIKRDPTGKKFNIVDLNSFNGTFVNGVPVQEMPLADGDQVTVGDVLLLFLPEEKEDVKALELVQIEDAASVTHSAIRLPREKAIYLHLDKRAGLMSGERAVHDLNVLLKISSAVSSIRERDQLPQRLLELIGEVIPAQRSAILLHETKFDEMIPASTWSRTGQTVAPLRISRTVISQVTTESVGLLCNDIEADERLGGAESLVVSEVRSLLCVPLAAFDRTLGVIYVDTSDPSDIFDETHLQLLTGIAEIAAIALDNSSHTAWLENENRRLGDAIQLEHKMIGESSPMREVYSFIARTAPTDSTVLIVGESGTGKELAAHALHANSPRAPKPFIAINCATLTDTLLESELFGHERGAFTGAVAQKRGKLEVADGGTLLLDEVGELAQPLQAKLLRVLQGREFERVGGTRTIKVDIRIIAATNKSLEQAVSAGSFRQDLYFRLNVRELKMPPLRDRRSDIPLLASYFAAKYSQKCKRRVTGFSAAARECLQAYHWPGNVRELENVIERAVVLGQTELILPEDLPETLLEATVGALMSPDSKPIRGYYEALKEEKKRLILVALEQANGNYSEAARSLGIHPNNLHRLIRNLGLKS